MYRGTAIPALVGRYVFGDFGSGNLFALLPEFGLALYQQPSGQDVRSALALRGETPAKSTVDRRAIQLDEA